MSETKTVSKRKPNGTTSRRYRFEASPVWQWPPSPAKIVHWFAVRWMPLTEHAVLVVIGLVCWMWLTPSLETMQTLHWQWIGAIWLRNLVLVISLLAGTLALVFPLGEKTGQKTQI